jgi:hypothetical protein
MLHNLQKQCGKYAYIPLNWDIHLRICALFSDAVSTSVYAESTSVLISE